MEIAWGCKPRRLVAYTLNDEGSLQGTKPSTADPTQIIFFIVAFRHRPGRKKTFQLPNLLSRGQVYVINANDEIVDYRSWPRCSGLCLPERFYGCAKTKRKRCGL